MWCTINISDEPNGCDKKYIVKTACSDATHTVFLCDIEHGFVEVLTQEDMLRRCKELNPLVEASPERLVAHVVALLDGRRDDVHRSLRPLGGVRVLALRSKLVGLLFSFEFRLQPAAGDHIYTQVMAPILATLLELHERQTCLMKLLKKKDEEIAEYKINGGQLSRRNLETPVFDEQEFARKRLELPFSADVVPDPRERLFAPVVQSLIADVVRKMDGCAARAANSDIGSNVKEEMQRGPESVTTAEENGVVNSVNSQVKTEASEAHTVSPRKKEFEAAELKNERGAFGHDVMADAKPPKLKKHNHKKALGL
ncbi:non-homologous end-joining factor 1-like [Bacillus rossius redtenbacheri]|uniref:non-homologous end-joining factor 1-like n=1 Tax=Bacillus rossius redtenbacheri TaxID=93214 RepID=UPI002FDD2E58